MPIPPLDSPVHWRGLERRYCPHLRGTCWYDKERDLYIAPTGRMYWAGVGMLTQFNDVDGSEASSALRLRRNSDTGAVSSRDEMWAEPSGWSAMSGALARKKNVGRVEEVEDAGDSEDDAEDDHGDEEEWTYGNACGNSTRNNAGTEEGDCEDDHRAGSRNPARQEVREDEGSMMPEQPPQRQVGKSGATAETHARHGNVGLRNISNSPFTFAPTYNYFALPSNPDVGDQSGNKPDTSQRDSNKGGQQRY